MSTSGLRVAAALAVAAAPGLAQAPDLSVEAIYGASAFASEERALQWLGDEHLGEVLTGPDGVTDLYRVEADADRRELWVRGHDLVPPGRSDPIAIEGYQLSPDGGTLLIYTNAVRVWRQKTKGEYYLWHLADARLVPLSGVPGYQQFAKFSPDGRYVGFVRDHDLFVRVVATGEEVRLTSDGSEHVINGTSDWVYEEELGLRDAFRFSPDGNRIAFWRFDQSAVRTFYVVDDLPQYPALTPIRYPKAGERNADVRIGVVEVPSGETTWIDTGADPDIYLAEMGFTGRGDELWLTRLNRLQNRLDVLVGDVRSGRTAVVMSDSAATWVEAAVPRWLDGGDRFLYPSDRGGYRQLHLFRRDGRLERVVTSGSWDVTEVYGVDERRDLVYFQGAAEGPVTRHLYRVGLNGKEIRGLSGSPGHHAATFNSSFTRYVDLHSAAGRPPVQSLHGADGTEIRVLADNAALVATLAELQLTPPRFLTVPVGGIELYAYLITPPDFDPSRRYPLLMYVYGGPTSQTVQDRWGGSRYLWFQLLARMGYLVASVDNRGTPGRGRDFNRVTYLNLGTFETEDQIGAARYFGSLPYVDASRVGIYGGSYGGYMALLSLLKGADVFKAGIAIAPVTHWKLYDTIYTERYMRTPQENPDGYRRSAPLTYADRLRGNLLVVHGTADDNVHAQHTTQLIEALVEADKQFDMRLYPGETHAVTGTNLYTYLTAWLRDNL